MALIRYITNMFNSIDPNQCLANYQAKWEGLNDINVHLSRHKPVAVTDVQKAS